VSKSVTRIQKARFLTGSTGVKHVTAKIGSGSNLTGYYMFTGAQIRIGILSSMRKIRDEQVLEYISENFVVSRQQSGNRSNWLFIYPD